MQQPQQHMSMALGGAITRPPPPEYKTAQAQLMHAGMGMAQQARFANPAAMRRPPNQQPVPATGMYYNKILYLTYIRPRLFKVSNL